MSRAFSRTLLVLMITQSATGLMWPALYRDSGWIQASWFGNDLVTLFVAAPLLTAGLFAVNREAERGRLVILGVAAYALYNYAFYALGAALNPFFIIYLVTILVAGVALASTASHADPMTIARHTSPRTPVRAIGGSMCVIAIGLAAVWAAMWARHVFGGHPLPVEPEAFRLVATLDLTLLAPALAASGVLLWKRRPIGYVAAAAACLQSGLYLLVLAVNSAFAVVTDPALAPGELPIWGTLALTMGVLGWILVAGLSATPQERPAS